jgi:mRNA-degrading endonuclease toxin of MazEF toxin-antitoxin module
VSKAQPPGQYQGQLRWATVDGSSRPWLIVQAEILNERAPTLLAVPVTLTPQEAGWPLTVRLDPDDTGFPRPSWVRVTLLRALKRNQLEEPIATLGQTRLDEITRAIATVLDIETAPGRHARKSVRNPTLSRHHIPTSTPGVP